MNHRWVLSFTNRGRLPDAVIMWFWLNGDINMPSEMKQVRVPLPEKQVQELAAAAAAQGISIAELIRQLLIKSEVITDPKINHGGSRK